MRRDRSLSLELVALFIALILSFLLAQIAVRESIAQGQTTVFVHGINVNSMGEAVRGGSVALLDSSGNTIEAKDLGGSHAWQFYRKLSDPGSYVVRYQPPQGWRVVDSDTWSFELPRDYPRVSPGSTADVVFRATEVAAATATPVPAIEYMLTAMAIDQNNLPVANVLVTVSWSTSSRTTYTDEDGIARFEWLGERGATVVIMAQHPRYVCEAIEAPNGTPVPQVTKTVDDTPIATDPSSCQIRIEQIPPGSYGPVVARLRLTEPRPTATATTTATLMIIPLPIYPTATPTLSTELLAGCSITIRIMADGSIEGEWECR